MKRKLGLLFLLLLVGLLIAYVLRYKTGTCICKTIPQEADAVIQVKVRSLERYFLHDVVLRPKSYFSSKPDSLKQKEKSDQSSSEPSTKYQQKVRLMDCVSLPKSLLLYRVDSIWYSSDLKIKDAVKLEQFLTDNNFKSNGSGDEKIYIKKNQKILVDQEIMKVAYKTELGTGLDFNTSEKSDFLSKGDQLFDATHSSQNDIYFVDNKGQFLNINFQSGVINIDGNYNLTTLKPSAKESSTKGIGSLSAQLDFPKFIELLSDNQKNKFSNFTKLNLDSLSGHINGELSTVLTDFSTSIDTITTYDYDDDFNKIEIKDIKESLEPSYSLLLGMDDEGIAYMKRQNAIVEQDGKDVLAIMPLVTTYSKQYQDALYLYTSDQDITEIQTTTSDAKFNFSFDVSQFLDKNKSDRDNKYLEDIDSMFLTIDNENNIEGKIAFRDKRNGLVTLIR